MSMPNQVLITEEGVRRQIRRYAVDVRQDDYGIRQQP